MLTFPVVRIGRQLVEDGRHEKIRSAVKRKQKSAIKHKVDDSNFVSRIAEMIKYPEAKGNEAHYQSLLRLLNDTLFTRDDTLAKAFQHKLPRTVSLDLARFVLPESDAAKVKKTTKRKIAMNCIQNEVAKRLKKANE